MFDDLRCVVGRSLPLIALMTCALGAQVVNDDCSTALPIGNGITVGSNIGATTSVQTAGCSNMGSDVWYLYTAPCSGTAEATFCQPGSANFDTVLAVFAATGSCPSLAPIACNDDTCLLKSRVLFPVIGGAAYLLAVGGFASVQGTFVLSLTCHQPPANDDCPGALPLGPGINGPFSNQFATDGATPPASGCPAGFADPWFTFQAPCAGSYRISTCGGGYDTIVSVHAGSCGGTTEIACNDDDPTGACGPGSTAAFAASAGASHLVRVAGATTARGSFNVTVHRDFLITYSSPAGPGSIAFTIAGGTPNGLYFDAITLNAGAFPNGAFYGIDLSATELADELAAGPPFFSSLDGCGDFVFAPIFAPAFSGIPFYSVVLTSDPTITLPIQSTPPTTYTIP